MAHPLRSTVADWLRLLKEAEKCRHEQFGQYAEECEKFYDSAHNWMWKNDYSRGPQGFVESAGDIPYPTFQMTVNRVFEAVSIFGPAMFQRYPQATVTPISPPVIPPELFGLDPRQPEYAAMLAPQQQEQQLRGMVAGLKEHYLNWLQVATEKKTHARRSITEALIAGLGVFLTEWHQPLGGELSVPRSRHISWKQILKDPDAKYAEDVQWIAIEWTHPVNLIEEQFNLPPGSLKGNQQSKQAQATASGMRDPKKYGMLTGASFDLRKYYEIYSRNGAGDKLKGAKSPYDLSSLGRFVRLVVTQDVHFPLNLPEEILGDPDAVVEAVQWPVPYWLDNLAGRGWPISELSYYDKSSCVWPVSLFKPVIGWMRFVNWVMSFLADKVAASSHEYIAVMKSAAKEIKEQLLTQKGPIKLIELSEMMGQNVNQVISILQKPTFDIGIFQMAERAMDQIDKGTGLTEMVYGITSTQIRSAGEANIRNDQISIRPDDMSEKTEDWYSAALAKEMIALAYHGEPEDVAPVLGAIGTQVFTEQVLNQNPELVVRNYNYRIASGSAKKPNKTALLQGLTEFGRVAGPVMQQLALAGMLEPWNAYTADVADALDLPNPGRYQVQLPSPEEQGPSPEEQEQEQDAEKHEQELTQSHESHLMEMAHQRQKMMLDAEMTRQKLKLAKQAKSNGKQKQAS